MALVTRFGLGLLILPTWKCCRRDSNRTRRGLIRLNALINTRNQGTPNFPFAPPWAKIIIFFFFFLFFQNMSVFTSAKSTVDPKHSEIAARDN